LINVDVSASTGAFVETVCLIAVRRSVSGWTGCRRCGRVGKTPRLCSSTCLAPSWYLSPPWSICPLCCLLCWWPWPDPNLWRGWDREGNRVDRWIKEVIHIRKEQDKSMNRDEGSYQLSHIYDILFTPKLSSERRLDRPFQRRLQSKPKRQH